MDSGLSLLHCEVRFDRKSDMSRTKIFIGHANPEDNEFTQWVQAKLRNEGYDVESDLTLLVGGEEDYWDVLQKALEDECCKYLLVLTKTSFTKAKLKQEFDFACSLGARLGIQDFVMLMKLDDVPFDVRMGTGTMNQFRFDRSWADAFKQLVRKLERDAVPHSAPGALSNRDWIMNRYTTDAGIVHDDPDTLYSNWLEIPPLRAKFWFHEFQTDAQAEAIVAAMSKIPAIRHGNYVVSFSDVLPEHEETSGFVRTLIKPRRKFSKPLASIDSDERAGRFPTPFDMRRFFVQLMKDAMEKHLREIGLYEFTMAHKQPCFFYNHEQLPKNRMHFIYEGERVYRQLVGDYYDAKWHYGLTFNVRLTPFPSFSFKGRLLFSNDGKAIWDSAADLHTARRKKGKSMYNEQWRMLFLAFLRSIADGDNIRVPLTTGITMMLAKTPVLFASNTSYVEPAENGRLVPIDYIDDEEDEIDRTTAAPESAPTTVA